MLRRMLAMVGWVEERSGAIGFVAPIMTHRVPRDAKWWYVFGSATLMFFMIQLVSGTLLATLYAPSAADAFQSLQYIDQQVPMGWMLRAIHGMSSNFMVIMVLVHMSQVFLHASFKYPRELTWMVGVLLLFCTLALAFTGQIMRWDQDAYWGLGIGASIVDRVPVLGNQMRNVLLGGPYIGGATLSRFFALHVFVLPGTTIALVGLHLALILKGGVSEMPKAGQLVDPATYKKDYEERVHKTGVPFFPDAAKRDMVFCGLALILMVGLAMWLGPTGPNGNPDPTIINANPRPDAAFLWIFSALALLALDSGDGDDSPSGCNRLRSSRSSCRWRFSFSLHRRSVAGSGQCALVLSSGYGTRGSSGTFRNSIAGLRLELLDPYSDFLPEPLPLDMAFGSASAFLVATASPKSRFWQFVPKSQNFGPPRSSVFQGRWKRQTLTVQCGDKGV